MQSAAGDSSRRRIESGQVLRRDERNGGKWLRRVAQIDIGLQAESKSDPLHLVLRKPKLTDHQKREVIRRRDIEGEAVREIARIYLSRTARFHGWWHNSQVAHSAAFPR